MWTILTFLVTLTILVRTSSGEGSNYISKALQVHNNYRALHNAPSLEWDVVLAKDASDYAQKLANDGGGLKPDPNTQWGQNLFELTTRGRSLNESQTDDAIIEQAIATWYQGNEYYNWINPDQNARQTYSFAQLVWLGSKKVGLGIGKNIARDSTKVIVIAMYSPPGNVQGEFQKNVLAKVKNGAIKVIPTSSTQRSIDSTPIHTQFSPLVSPSPTFTPPRSTSPVNNLQVSEAEIVGRDLHNKLRQSHRAPPLQLDSELSAKARELAQAIFQKTDRAQPQLNKYGRNVYQSFGAELTPVQAVTDATQSWGSSVTKYNWRDPLKSDTNAGLFTAMVWKATTQLGIGVYITKKDERQHTVVVAYYNPAGNIQSKESQTKNVLKRV